MKKFLLAVALVLAAPALAETSVLRSLPAKTQKDIEGVRAECRKVSEQATSGDEGLTTFTLSGAQAVLIDNLELCAGGQCLHGINCATGYSHRVDIYVRAGSAWRVFSWDVTEPIFLHTEARPTTDGWTQDNPSFRAMVIKIHADSKDCPAITREPTEWKRRSCAYVVKWDEGAKRFTRRPL